MASQSYLSEKERSYTKRSTNINDHLSRAKFERRKEKRATYIVTTAGIAVLLILAVLVLI